MLCEQAMKRLASKLPEWNRALEITQAQVGGMLLGAWLSLMQPASANTMHGVHSRYHQVRSRWPTM